MKAVGSVERSIEGGVVAVDVEGREGICEKNRGDEREGAGFVIFRSLGMRGESCRTGGDIMEAARNIDPNCEPDA